MKTRSIINYVALVIPFILGLVGYVTHDDDYYFYALFSTAGTGAIQVIIALSMLSKYGSDLLNIYLVITVVFFISWYLLGEEFGLIAIPPALAIFLTYIIYAESTKKNIISKN